MKTLITFCLSHKIFAGAMIALSVALSGYARLPQTLLAFGLITTLDTITSINAGAYAKGLKFNPFKGYFWREIKSGLMRVWFKKIFKEYMIYVILAFVLDILILEQQIYMDIMKIQINIPIVVIWALCGLELWSIGENIAKTGKPNYIALVWNFMKDYLQDKFKIKSKKDEN